MSARIYPISDIGDGSLGVMAKPASGSALDSVLSGMAETGVNRIVSLLEKKEAQSLGLENEQQVAQQHGMEFVSFPIQDLQLPSSLQDYLEFTKLMVDETALGLFTVVHCRAGIGRSGMIAAGMLLHCGYCAEDALSYISFKRGVKVPDTQQQADWVVQSARTLGIQ